MLNHDCNFVRYGFFDSVKDIFESINRAITSLSEKYASARLSSEEKNIVVILNYDWHFGNLIV